MNDFYVYVHKRATDGTIFYVGKGSNNRSKIKAKRNKLWRNVVNKHGYIVEHIADNLTEAEALKFESVLIEQLGRRDIGTGPLVNMTDGGEGLSGVVRTSETRNKIRQAHTGRKHTKQSRLNMSKAHLGHTPSEETRAKMSASQTGRRHTADSKQKMCKPRNLTIYRFEHVDGTVLMTTIHALVKRYALSSGNVNSIVKGTRKQTKGWSCVGKAI